MQHSYTSSACQTIFPTVYGALDGVDNLELFQDGTKAMEIQVSQSDA